MKVSGATGRGQAIVSKWNPGYGGNYELGLTADLRPFFQIGFSGSGTWAFSDTPLSTGVWHHLSGSYDGSVIRLYVDGNLAAAYAISGQVDQNDLPTTIGRSATQGAEPTYRCFNGVIDEVMITVPNRFEENDPSITYTGAWNTYTDSRCSGGTLKYSSQRWTSATFSFNGTGIKWVVAKAPMCGKAKVYLDGTYLGMVDLYSAAAQFQVVLQKTGLPSGDHTLYIEVSRQKNPSATDYNVDIDAFEVVP